MKINLSSLPWEIIIKIRRLVYAMNQQAPYLLNDIRNYYIEKKLYSELDFVRYNSNFSKFNLIKEIDINNFLQRLFKCKFNAKEIFNTFNENKKINLMLGLMLPHERDINIKLNYRSYF
jgi:hypothetical protein